MRYRLLFALLLVAGCQAASDKEQLRQWYDQNNEQYFLGMLPKDTVIDYSLHDDEFMGATTKIEGKFHISLNRKYNLAVNVAKVTLYHEECHVSTWGEIEQHGLRWKSCMHRIENEGAFEGLL